MVQCMRFADVIIDISHENLDKTYQYAVPEELEDSIVIGTQVVVPFGKGNTRRNGFVLAFSDKPKFPVEKTKSIIQILQHSVVLESQLIALAVYIRETFGATLNDALRTVLPVKKTIKNKENKFLTLRIPENEAADILAEYNRKHYTARARLLSELISENTLNQELVTGKLGITTATIKDMVKLGIIEVSSEIIYRNPVKEQKSNKEAVLLNEDQRRVVDVITAQYLEGVRDTYLIHGVTGSGKTEVYMELIANVLARNKQVIVLIPEIALTYQTVKRFYQRFGNQVSIINSRMSQGERYDQYLRAKNGQLKIMIGPRSALFTPFEQLGLIIIDEEHEGSYKSEMPPKYHAREVALERARLADASVVLGSATPSVDSYQKALSGEYQLFTLLNRAGNATMPQVEICDLREELKAKNRSIFSRRLRELMADRLNKQEQIMLFINRRGFAGFVSCRSCGEVMTCPHCDISLTQHNNGKLVCHYCGYEILQPKHCPSCSSPYIAAFGIGTQKVEEYVAKEFPQARVLRMDMDTTSGKEGHEKILEAFSNHQADILVGTQMIVKGHDYSNVTLVGVIAADLSLHASDYRAAERTFQLLAQAAGRAGRGEKAGNVVIQTYNPEQYSIVSAANNDYLGFYDQEIAYRQLMMYPPVSNIMAALFTSKEEKVASDMSELIKQALYKEFQVDKNEDIVRIIGPAKASLAKINDIYRYLVYIKCIDLELLKKMKEYMEGFYEHIAAGKDINMQLDMNPMTGY